MFSCLSQHERYSFHRDTTESDKQDMCIELIARVGEGGSSHSIKDKKIFTPNKIENML